MKAMRTDQAMSWTWNGAIPRSSSRRETCTTCASPMAPYMDASRECKLFDFGDGRRRVLRSYIRPTVQGLLPCGLDGFRNRHLISLTSSKLKAQCRFESIPGHPVCHHLVKSLAQPFGDPPLLSKNG